MHVIAATDSAAGRFGSARGLGNISRLSEGERRIPSHSKEPGHRPGSLRRYGVHSASFILEKAIINSTVLSIPTAPLSTER